MHDCLPVLQLESLSHVASSSAAATAEAAEAAKAKARARDLERKREKEEQDRAARQQELEERERSAKEAADRAKRAKEEADRIRRSKLDVERARKQREEDEKGMVAYGRRVVLGAPGLVSLHGDASAVSFAVRGRNDAGDFVSKLTTLNSEGLKGAGNPFLDTGVVTYYEQAGGAMPPTPFAGRTIVAATVW
jgi:hypothetical protein